MRSAAAGDRRSLLGELLQPAGILARNDPRVRLLEGLEQHVDVLDGDVPDTVPITRRPDRVRRRPAARAEDRGCSSISARIGSPPRSTRAAGCSTASATTAASRWSSRRCRGTIAIDISEDAIGARRARTPRATADERARRTANVFDELRGARAAGRALRHDRPRSAGVREEQGRRSEGDRRLQGNQPARAEAAERRRHRSSPAAARTTSTKRCSPRSSTTPRSTRRTDVTVVEKRMQGRDHPVLLGVPETYYLKCFILRKLA